MSRSTAAQRRRSRPRARTRGAGRRALLGLAVVVVGAVVVIAFPQLLDGGATGGSIGGSSDGTVRPPSADASVPSSVPASAVPATVERVVDGDTVVVVAADGARERLRLIGVDTPETVKPDAPVDCFGPEASAFTTDALPVGSTVWLEGDASQGDADRYDRLLRYVWTEGGGLLNQQLVASGLGEEDTYDQPYRYRDAFVAAEAAARDSGAGLWGACR